MPKTNANTNQPDLLELPSGAQLARNPLKGEEFFKYLDLAGSGQDSTRWLMLHAVDLWENGDRQPLTIDTLDEMDFFDVSALNQTLQAPFNDYSAIARDWDQKAPIKLPNGMHLTRKKLKGGDFFQFQQVANKGTMPAVRWLIINCFDLQDAAPYPTNEGTIKDLPFDTVMAMGAIAQHLFVKFQAVMKSSPPAVKPDGA